MSKRKLLIPVIIFTTIVIILIIMFNPINKYVKLSINENKWNSIKKSN